jgi:hypothetical protein
VGVNGTAFPLGVIKKIQLLFAGLVFENACTVSLGGVFITNA